jgi:hypothetical protein
MHGGALSYMEDVGRGSWCEATSGQKGKTLSEKEIKQTKGLECCSSGRAHDK